MNSLYSSRNESWLSWFLRGVLIFLFLILIGKLFEIQIIKGSYYRELSEENRIRHIPIPAPRGRILAINGEVLADNVAIKKKVEINNVTGLKLSEDLTNASPDEIVIDYKRVYPLASKFGHASGYISQIDGQDVGTVDPLCPEKGVRTAGILVGVTGLEQQYECELRGKDGENLIEVDTRGKKIRTLAIKQPTPGRDIKTSINYGLQQELANQMDNIKESKKGAAIVTDPRGQILAYYSAPSYDPNLFITALENADMSFYKNVIDKNDSVKLNALLKNQDLPLFDRVIRGTFHPGSVFKPIVALAALEEKAIDKNYTYNDLGLITVNGFSYRNWYFTEYGRLEGTINLVKAIARSTDTFFYKIGELTGPENIAKWADLFDLDKVTGIDLPHESKGLIPTPEWKKKVIKEGWFLGNTYNMSIGQGDVSMTPVEVNTYISGIANNGLICPPHFLITDKEEFKCKQIGVNKNNIDLIKEGMKAACSDGGTAYTFFDFSAKHNSQTVACKTGTAEVGADGIPHAWFTLFSPANDSKIILTVLVERGGQGSQVAGPVARKIVDYYFENSN